MPKLDIYLAMWTFTLAIFIYTCYETFFHLYGQVFILMNIKMITEGVKKE